MRRWIAFVTILILLLTTIPFAGVNAQEKPKFKVLEITDSGVNSIANSLGNAVEVTSIPMKRFVAMRDELDGKYDAIYIAKGKENPYSTAFPTLDPNPTAAISQLTNTKRADTYNTTNVMNDITLLKFSEIERYYINRKLPVLVDPSVLKQQPNTQQVQGKEHVLKTKFGSMQQSVQFVEPQAAVTMLRKLAESSMRPRLTPLNDTYITNYKNKYNPGDTVNFSFKMPVGNPDVTQANFYIDLNFNNKFEASERVYTNNVKVMQKTDYYSFSYQLPSGYAGIRRWKLELVDNRELKDYSTGVFYVNGRTIDINVLQVLSGNSMTDGSLLEILKAHLDGDTIRGDGYNIKLNVVTMNQFISPTCTQNCYKTINNGTYNMLIFGLKDEYGSAKLAADLNRYPASDSTPVGAVKRFIESGQSVFMTHDTLRRDRGGIDSVGKSNNDVLRDTNSWFVNFLPYSGQMYPTGILADYESKTIEQKLLTPGKYYLETNLGRGGQGVIGSVTNTQRVNEGMITQFPHQLKGNVNVASTHAQYFALDLEDPAVMPWYNLNHSKLDNSDSYNHYYIYSRNNITYTGAGHTSNTLTPDEQLLFINTMYTAFAGANHAPLITVHSPKTGTVVPSNQKQQLSFTVEDLDAKDRLVNVRIFVNEEEVGTTRRIVSGTTVSEEVDLKRPDGGQATIRIEATDDASAKQVETITLQVEKTAPDLEVTRMFSKMGMVKVNEDTIKVDYTLQAQKIAESGVNGQEVKVSGLRPFAMHQSIEKKLGPPGTKMSFDDFMKSTKRLKFTESIPNDVQEGLTKSVTITELNNNPNIAELIVSRSENRDEYEEELIAYVNRTKNATLTIAIVSNLGKHPNFVKFAQFQLQPSKLIKGEIDVTFTGIVDDNVYALNNIVYSETFPKGITVDVSSSSILQQQVNSDGTTTVTGYIGDILYKREKQLFTAEEFRFSVSMKAVESGDFTLKQGNVTYINVRGKEERAEIKPHVITARQPLKDIRVPDNIELNIDSVPQNVIITQTPKDAIVASYQWEVQSPIVKVDSITHEILPIQVGETKIRVIATDIFGTSITSNWITVVVKNPIRDIRMPEEITLRVGETRPLGLVVIPESAIEKLQWTNSAAHIASVSSDDYSVTGRAPGTTVITARGEGMNGEVIEKAVRVTVRPYLSAIRVTPNEIEVIEGQTRTLQLSVQVGPEDAGDKGLSWSLSNPIHSAFMQIEDVNSANEEETTQVVSLTITGKVPTNLPIPITVRARDGGGAQTTVYVMVKSSFVPLEDLYFSPDRLIISVGETRDLRNMLQFVPANATNKRIESWHTSNPQAVIVSGGVIVGKVPGTSVITAVSQGKAKTVTVTVQEQGSILPNPDLPLLRW
ncbi:DUF5057 domain-containing protein [Ectobacillus antri]|jgi:hypothetical protein|uniref:DUF5057 domain-containing protein n=1 Tax=Ectobacillus antri TaxID=2486280 RepID=A0ABT6H4Y6_9BACI|nr:DUF5057 domain-containing protein [Ectobacillus antri]MDG4657471.1 DUF5057 domain-containing protein [Ectobacillus antri]MDG5753784.1 DUF5057 domain-containing protein [Ectobacillus antri]